MILKDIGKRLKTFRKSNGYTQEQFSELLNMSLNFYGKIERGQSRLSIEKLVLLHEKFDIDIDYLLTGTPSKNVDYNSVLSDCPKDKVFDFEQLIRYSVFGRAVILLAVCADINVRRVYIFTARGSRPYADKIVFFISFI